MPKIRSF